MSDPLIPTDELLAELELEEEQLPLDDEPTTPVTVVHGLDSEPVSTVARLELVAGRYGEQLEECA